MLHREPFGGGHTPDWLVDTFTRLDRMTTFKVSGQINLRDVFCRDSGPGPVVSKVKSCGTATLNKVQPSSWQATANPEIETPAVSLQLLPGVVAAALVAAHGVQPYVDLATNIDDMDRSKGTVLAVSLVSQSPFAVGKCAILNDLRDLPAAPSVQTHALSFTGTVSLLSQLSISTGVLRDLKHLTDNAQEIATCMVDPQETIDEEPEHLNPRPVLPKQHLRRTRSTDTSSILRNLHSDPAPDP